MQCKRVAVIGGGLAGLGAIKALKEESIEPVCFERYPEIGGTWYYREEDSDYDTATVMSTTSLNQSKELGAVSNFPFPSDSSNYMRHDEVHKYITQLSDAFDLRRHITCNREVIAVKKAFDYEESGRWDVTVRNTESRETITETFDAVIVCTGNHGPPNMPSYPGMEKFRGRIMHSQKLRTFESFAGQNVVVVGTGCSALDAAVEISNVAKQVYWSVRSQTWISPRIGSYGLPIDYLVFRRYILFLQFILPISWMSKLFEHFYLDTRFNHKLYGIDPEYPLMCKDPAISDHIATKLMNGSVDLRKNIREIGEDYVIFEGETECTKVDTIIMATGYKFHIPCVEEGVVLHEEKGKILLYRGVFPPQLRHPTISFMCYILPLGPGIPIGEMQSRWITHILSGKGSLPSEKQMMKEIEQRYERNVKRFSPSDKMSQRVDLLPYVDELASEIGVKPNFWKMAFTDPQLFIACIFGPYVSYQYRLVGPHKWDGARHAILTVSERVKAPLKQSEKGVSSWDHRENHILCKILLVIEVVLLMLFNRIYYSLFSFAPVILAGHLMLTRSVGGKFLLYCFLPVCITSWLWFPAFLSYLLIFQATFALACN